jgi:hypothetical protein
MVSVKDRRIIILHNFDRDDYSKLLGSLKSTGLGDNTIVAVTTATTLDWKVGHLLEELLLEDESLKGQTKR